ncbi:hypothetical protein EJ08DRAFT_677544 [Tothia fuscella]|uniref:Uncharacterized protein n=1 Tax=Tothia fuscella TaxID=1048955 RepID=A0A9P4NVY0_9PEZI|nr:hypothetical protein EJ08DRAFT_677544 [Tothia fuscella]
MHGKSAGHSSGSLQGTVGVGGSGVGFGHSGMIPGGTRSQGGWVMTGKGSVGFGSHLDAQGKIEHGTSTGGRVVAGGALKGGELDAGGDTLVGAGLDGGTGVEDSKGGGTLGTEVAGGGVSLAGGLVEFGLETGDEGASEGCEVGVGVGPSELLGGLEAGKDGAEEGCEVGISELVGRGTSLLLDGAGDVDGAVGDSLDTELLLVTVEDSDVDGCVGTSVGTTEDSDVVVSIGASLVLDEEMGSLKGLLVSGSCVVVVVSIEELDVRAGSEDVGGSVGADEVGTCSEVVGGSVDGGGNVSVVDTGSELAIVDEEVSVDTELDSVVVLDVVPASLD